MGFDVRTRLAKLRSSAKARKIFVNLDIDKYQNLIDIGCVYCGDDLSKQNGYCLDRVDPNKGYTLTNVKHCNIAKNTMGVEEFLKWIERAYHFTQKKLKMVQEMHESGFVYTVEEEVAAHKKHGYGRIKYVP